MTAFENFLTKRKAKMSSLLQSIFLLYAMVFGLCLIVGGPPMVCRMNQLIFGGGRGIAGGIIRVILATLGGIVRGLFKIGNRPRRHIRS